jgi:hypothetical protein
MEKQCCGSAFGIRCLFDHWVRDSDSGSGFGMNIPDHNSESLETIFGLKILKFFAADADPGSGIFFTLDPG